MLAGEAHYANVPVDVQLEDGNGNNETVKYFFNFFFKKNVE